jgi:glycosyltransferase involved in cell wall biosynthesis
VIAVVAVIALIAATVRRGTGAGLPSGSGVPHLVSTPLVTMAGVHIVDVVLPVLDEAGALPTVLHRMPAGHHPIVVDNGSTDGSGDVAAALGAQVIVEPVRGFGSACAAGLAAATAPVVAFCDADASLDPRHLPRVTTPVLRGEADLVLGARTPTVRGVWPWHARLANRYLARRVRRATGWCITDLGPMRAARRDALLGLGVADRRSGWPLEQLLLAGAAGWRAVEVPVPYEPRIGRSKVSGSVTGTLTAVLDMAEVLRRHGGGADRSVAG